MPLDVEHIDEICADVERQYRDKISDCVLFMMKVVPEGIPAIDAQEAYQTAAYLAANIGASDEMVVAYLEKAIEAMPKSDAVPGIQATIDMIKSAAESTEELPATDEGSK